MTTHKPNLLFVCARNKWRSPTAERVYKSDRRVSVRSAGLKDKSAHKLSERDIEWADLILVMEHSQIKFIRQMYHHLDLPPIESLEIPDDYQYMDDELVELIQKGSEMHIQRLVGT